MLNLPCVRHNEQFRIQLAPVCKLTNCEQDTPHTADCSAELSSRPPLHRDRPKWSSDADRESLSAGGCGEAGLPFCPSSVERLDAWIIALNDGRGTENGEWMHPDSSTTRPSIAVKPSSTAAAGAKLPSPPASYPEVRHDVTAAVASAVYNVLNRGGEGQYLLTLRGLSRLTSLLTTYPMFALASLLAFLAATASALPTLRVRQQGASCAGLADGSTDSPSYNFTLAAVNTTLPNANSTGAPLVLGWGPSGTSPAASAWSLSVSVFRRVSFCRVTERVGPDIRRVAFERMAIFHALRRCSLSYPWPRRVGSRGLRP